MSLGLDVDLRRLRPACPPVLLLGGLDLLRPLGFAGIPAIVATPYARDPAFASRYCGGRCLLPPLNRREAVAETLLNAGDRLASAVGSRVPLFYGNDDYLTLIYAFRDEFAQRFRLLLNDSDVARALIEKDRFEPLARARGLGVSRSLTWGDTGPDALGRAEGPVAVKPKMKQASPAYLQLFGDHGKARIFDNGRMAMTHRLVDQLKDELIFQEFVPGDDRQLWSFHGIADEKGSLLAWFIGHKLRTYPPLTGMSTFVELAHDDELAAIGRDTVARIPLKGPFKIDFKRGADDGRFRILEINARFNLWHHVAARNGVNLPQVAYDYLVHGARPTGTAYRTTFRWLCCRLDFRAFRELASRGELSVARWLLSLLLSRKVYALFSWTDPAPCLRVGGDRVRSRLRRGLDVLAVRLRQWRSTAF